MTRLTLGNSRLQGRPNTGKIKFYWLVVFLMAASMWPFSTLTFTHFIFFGVLSIGLYLSYSRLILPLAVYFSMLLLYWVIVPFLQGSVGVKYYNYTERVPDFDLAALAFVMTHFLGICVGLQIKTIRTSCERFYEAKFSSLGLALALLLLTFLITFVGTNLITHTSVEQRLMNTDVQSHIVLLRNLMKIIPAFLIIYVLLEARNNLKSYERFLVLAVLTLCFVIISNPINTSRFLSIFGLFVIIIAYTIKSSKIYILSWAVALIPIYAIFLLSATSALRHGLDNLGSGTALQSLRSLEFSSYSVFLDALKVESFSNSNYLISHILIIIPRSLWSGKAESIGIETAERSGYIFTNVGLNSFFNSYADFGYFGLFIFSVFFGVLAKNLNPVLKRPSFRNRRFMYGVIFTGMIPMFFRGDLSTAVLAFYPAILAYELIRLTTRFRLVPQSK